MLVAATVVAKAKALAWAWECRLGSRTTGLGSIASAHQ